MMLTISTLDASGNVIRASYTSAAESNLTLPKGLMPAVKVQVVWPEKVRDYTLPFNLKDVDIDAAAPPANNQGSGIRGDPMPVFRP